MLSTGMMTSPSFISVYLTILIAVSLSHYPSSAFQNVHLSRYRNSASSISTSLNEASRISIPSAELDESLGLTPDEKTVVNIHRVCSPSVVYITSVLKQPTSNRKSIDNANINPKQLPRGQALGSGSGFVVNTTPSCLYIITNYHVVQRAYETNRMFDDSYSFWNNLGGNLTKVLGRDLPSLDNRAPAQVFVRFGSDDNDSRGVSRASYFPCEIVDVVKELDVAVLRLDVGKDTSNSDGLPFVRALSYGQSSDLLVGQTLLAIGNPFGLDRTITSGIVSALGRSVTGVAGNPINNCIQTDASINPGNSGGPLLNMKGEVVGVNTMIISTSGSSAGIGFAVPGDSVRESTENIIDMDKEKYNRRSNRKGRGWLGVDVALESLESSLRKRVVTEVDRECCVGAFVTSIASDSPLKQSESRIEVTAINNGKVSLGDRIIYFGGNEISNGSDLVKELKGRVEGEQITLTVEGKDKEKRVVYVTLGKMPIID